MEIIENPLFFGYLTCSKSHAFRYLADRIDITPLLWNAYEPVSSIFEEIILNSVTPWEYKWELKPFMDELGIIQENVVVENFQAGKDTIIQLLKEGYTVQLSAMNGFIPHMSRNAQESVHSLALTSYNENEDTFILFDYPCKYEYEAQIIQEGYDHVEGNCFCYYRIEEGNYQKPSVDHLFQERIMGLADDFSGYERLKHLVEDGSIETHKISFFFGVVSLSREITSVFLTNYNYSFYLTEILKKISLLTEILKQLFIKISLKKKTSNNDFANIHQKIGQITILEAEFLNGIRHEITSGEKINSSVIISNPNPPNEVLIKYMTDSSAWLVWSDLKEEELESYKYEIYVNSELSAISKESTYIISDLIPDTKYVVGIRSVNKYGLRSVAEKTITIQTTVRKEFGNLSLYKPVFASSFEDMIRLPYNVVDDDELTRWSSVFRDNEWVCIDLGLTKVFNRIRLRWEEAYAHRYRIQISENLEIWSDVHIEEAGKGGVEEITNLACNARYVRIWCEKRATNYGFSLWELSVFNDNYL